MKNLSVVLAALLFCVLAWGGDSVIRSIRIGGDAQATLLFVGVQGQPEISVRDNILELTFKGAKLAETLNGKLDVESPHTLIRRVSIFETETGAKANVFINGTVENLKSRLTLTSDNEGLVATLDYPRVASAALNLLKEEQAPVVSSASSKKEESKMAMIHWVISAAVIIVAGITAFFFIKFLKAKGSWRGSRKYLIEQLGYCPLGTKTGVSLLKIGKDFVLVGVTPNQVTFLSSLPKLREQYEDEAQFERGVFREAVNEEFEAVERSANA